MMTHSTNLFWEILTFFLKPAEKAYLLVNKTPALKQVFILRTDKDFQTKHKISQNKWALELYF